MASPLLSTLAVLVLGLAMAFFGYRLLKLMLALAGFILGAAAVYHLLPTIGLESPTGLFIGSVIGGLIAAAITFPLFLVGLFALGAASGVLLVQLFGLEGSWLALILGIVAGGLLAVIIQRPLIILITALDGTALALLGFLALVRAPMPTPPWLPLHHTPLHPGELPGSYPPLFWVALVALTVIAAIYQFRDHHTHEH